MTVYKVIADDRPLECLLCPLKHSGIKIDMGQCGKKIKTNLLVVGLKKNEYQMKDVFLRLRINGKESD